MLNPTALLIDACVDCLREAYGRTYGQHEANYADLIAWAGRMTLECIADSDALYHNAEHTVLVTLAGQDILIGKQIREGNVSPRDWLHCIISLLYHDIGYVRGVCQDDREGSYTTGVGAQTILLPPGATDAALAPYHVDRGKCFVRERMHRYDHLDVEVIAANIERTRFPIPNTSAYQATADYPGLVRAADLIGQLADPHRTRKLPALFHEFAETGVNAQLGYTTPADLHDDYPAFFWNVVHRYIQDGLYYLRATQDGKQWIANLYAQVFTVERHNRLAGASTTA